jgi:hypothetical protein
MNFLPVLYMIKLHRLNGPAYITYDGNGKIINEDSYKENIIIGKLNIFYKKLNNHIYFYINNDYKPICTGTDYFG